MKYHFQKHVFTDNVTRGFGMELIDKESVTEFLNIQKVEESDRPIKDFMLKL